jgi:hypothetical protein
VCGKGQPRHRVSAARARGLAATVRLAKAGPVRPTVSDSDAGPQSARARGGDGKVVVVENCALPLVHPNIRAWRMVQLLILFIGIC